MAAPQPAKNNKFRTSGGGKEEDFVVTPPSFSFSMPPPMKKAKHCHSHRHCGGGAKISGNKNNSSINGGGEEELLNNKKNGRQLMSPTDVLAHPAAAAINNGSRRQEAAFIRTLPPSLRGINEAAKTLQLSSRCSKNNITTSSASPRNPQQQTPQLVAFPTEALYVLTCCVKTTSQKKLLRSNTNDGIIIKSRNDSVASSSLIGSSSPGSCSFASGTVALGEGEDTPDCSNSSGVGDCGGSGDIDFSMDRKKQAIHCDAVHPPNSSLDHLLSRIGPNNQEVSREGAPSVFVLGNKHAQHYCEFSTPKMFAIRPKQRSGSSSQLLKKREEEEKEAGCSEETCSPSSPIKSSQQNLSSSSPSLSTDWPMTVPPSPKKSCTIPASTSSSSLFVPVTPKTSAEGVAAHAVTPIAANNTVAVNTTTAKIHAVNFSESYEAFSRLANKFWPGPMIIYAPARMVGGGGGEQKGNGSGRSGSTDRKDLRSSPTLQQQQQRTWSRQSSSGSSASSSSLSEGCPSLPSFTNLQNLNTGGAAGAEGGAMDSNSSKVSVLPPSVLIPERDLLPGRDYSDCGSSRENNRFFIGMQCPSHPLSRKLLTEVHRPRRASASSTSVSTIAHSPSTDSLASFSSLDTSSAQQQQIRCGIAVVGSYIQPLTLAATSSSLSSDVRDDQEDKGNGHGGTILATSASNVKEILSTSPNQSNTEQILVVNGEDSTREHWSVPTCNYVTHPISLVVDGDNRTIHLLHNNRHDGGGASASGSDHSKEMIYRALLQPSSSSKPTTASLNMENGSNKGASTTSRSEIDRVITAVLSRWKVVEG
ncbi:hypothetical protein ACHAWC_010680 [Mediolabrus comicus]